MSLMSFIVSGFKLRLLQGGVSSGVSVVLPVGKVPSKLVFVLMKEDFSPVGVTCYSFPEQHLENFTCIKLKLFLSSNVLSHFLLPRKKSLKNKDCEEE